MKDLHDHEEENVEADESADDSDATNEPDAARTPGATNDDEPAKEDEPDEQPTGKALKGGALGKAWAWLRAKKKRMILAGGGLAVVLVTAVIGLTGLRYPVLGAIWKSEVDLRVVDSSSALPVVHATVSLAGQTAFTDKTGAAKFTRVKPGKTTVVVSRVAYATSSQAQTIGFGSVSLGTVQLKATGVTVISQVSNVLSGESVQGVEVKAGDVQAITDSAGKAVLVFPPSANNTTQDMEYSKDGFNTLQTNAKVQVGGKPITAAVVPAGKVFYLSNRSGKVDLYSSDLNGTNPSIVLAGTGSEDTETGILTNSKNAGYLAFVSSREGKRDQYGNFLHALYILNTESQKYTKIEDSFSFTNYRAWVGNSLVYERYPTNGNCPDIKSYDPTSQKSSILVTTAGTDNCARLLEPYDDGFFYTISAGASDKSGVYYAQAGKATKQVSNTPSQSIIQKTKHTLLSVYYTYSPTYQAAWQSIDLDALTSTKVANGPADGSRTYNDSPGDKHSSFIDQRDGKTELYLTDSDGGNEKKLTNIGAVNQFVAWMGDDYIVFSVSKADENALYVVAVSNGKTTKITDFYRANSRTYGGGSSPNY